jgi:hypothetical protein
MDIDYNNINTLIKILYEFVYSPNKDTYKNYLFEEIDINLIELSELIKNNFNYDSILKNKVNVIDTFTTNALTTNALTTDSLNSDALKTTALTTTDSNIKKMITTIDLCKDKSSVIAVFQKHGNNNKDTVKLIDIYYELLLQHVISSFVIVNKIPFYLLNICNFNISYKQFEKYDNIKNLLVKNFDLTDYEDRNSLFCISLYENYFDSLTLVKYLQSDLSNDELTNIIFQVLFSYAYLSFKLNNFRHNDFSIHSFIINKLPKTTIYNISIGDNNFTLKTDIVCKLFNFRKSQIDGLKNIYNYTMNSSYDIYYFLKSIYDFTYKNKKNYDKIKIIISNIIPFKFVDMELMDEELFMNKYVDTIIPLQILLKNNFFTKFINMKDNISRNIIDNNSPTEPTNNNRRLLAKKESGSKTKPKSIPKKSTSKKSKSKSKKSKSKLSRLLSGDGEEEKEEEEVKEEEEEVEEVEEEEEVEVEVEEEEEEEEKEEKKKKHVTKKEVEEEEEVETDSESIDDIGGTDNEDNLKFEIKNLKKQLLLKEMKLNKKDGKIKRVHNKKIFKSLKNIITSNNNGEDSLTTLSLGGATDINQNQNQNQNQFISTGNPKMDMILKNIDSNKLIPILPEMEGMFNENDKLNNSNQQLNNTNQQLNNTSQQLNNTSQQLNNTSQQEYGNMGTQMMPMQQVNLAELSNNPNLGSAVMNLKNNTSSHINGLGNAMGTLGAMNQGAINHGAMNHRAMNQGVMGNLGAMNQGVMGNLGAMNQGVMGNLGAMNGGNKNKYILIKKQNFFLTKK